MEPCTETMNATGHRETYPNKYAARRNPSEYHILVFLLSEHVASTLCSSANSIIAMNIPSILFVLCVLLRPDIRRILRVSFLLPLHLFETEELLTEKESGDGQIGRQAGRE